MKNDNLLVGLLVVAIVIAIAGTWMNLQTVSKISGAAVGGFSQTQEEVIGDVTSTSQPGDQPIVADSPISIEAVDVDCVAWSYNTSPVFPGAETEECNGGNWTTEMKNLSCLSQSNSDKINFNLTGTNPFTYSNIYAGYASIVNGTTGDGEILSTAWDLEVTPGEGSDTYAIARNVTSRQNVVIVVGQAVGVYWNETSSSYSVTWAFETIPCNATTC